MISIRPAQMSQMSDARRKEFLQTLEHSLGESWDDEPKPGEVSALAQKALQAGEAAGLVAASDLLLFAHLLQALGPNFAPEPLAKEILGTSNSASSNLRQIAQDLAGEFQEPAAATAGNSSQYEQPAEAAGVPAASAAAAGEGTAGGAGASGTKPPLVRPRVDLPPFAPEPPGSGKPKVSPKRKLDLLRILAKTAKLAPVAPSAMVMRCSIVREVVTIAIQEAPGQTLLVQPAMATLTLHGVNRHPPAGGVLQWQVLAGNNLVNIPGPTNHMQLTLTPTGLAGAAIIELRHTYNGVTATDQVTIYFVELTVVPFPRAAALLGNPIALQATGTPGGGVYAWVLNPNPQVIFQGGVLGPITTANVTLDTQQGGSTSIDVSYTAHGVTAQRTVDVEVLSLGIDKAPEVALLPKHSVELKGSGLPVGGHYKWTFVGPNPAIAAFHGASPGAKAVLIARKAGSVTVQLAYTLHGQTLTATVKVHIPSVSIQPAPKLSILTGAQVQLRARGSPDGGNYLWRSSNTALLDAHGPANLNTVTLQGRQGGSTHVQVDYVFMGLTVTDSVMADIVDVAIAGAKQVAVVFPADDNLAGAVMRLNAVGSPVGGAYLWTVANTSVAVVHSSAAVANPEFRPVAPGRTNVTVAYTAGTAQATDIGRITVAAVRIDGDQPVAMLLPGPGADAATSDLRAVGAPDGGSYLWDFTAPAIAAIPRANDGDLVTIATAAAGATRARVRYTVDGVTASDEREVFIVGVTITGAVDRAVAMHATGVAANTIQIIAVGTPARGAYDWTVQDATIATFHGGGAAPGNVDRATFDSVAPGTTDVTVTYKAHGLEARATIHLHVVAVTIQEGDRVTMFWPNAGPNPTQVLNAVGVPPGGTYAWRNVTRLDATRPSGVGYQGARNASASTVVTQAVGDSNVPVRYTLHGANADAAIEVIVRSEVCSLVDWSPAGAANVAPQPFDPCEHHAFPADYEHPSSVGAGGQPTGPAVHPHHHGEKCQFCTPHQGRDAHHYLNCDSGSEAVTEVVRLRDELHHLRGLAGPNQANYITSHPWLNNITGLNQFNSASAVTPMGHGGARVRGKMIGVLIGYDQQGRKYKLRAISGHFPGGAGLSPNGYWARKIPQHWVIDTASRGQWTFAAQQHADNQFGDCAATHLLSEALQLNLQIESMAEIWFGGRMNVGARTRLDGEMVTSCQYCRAYLNYMLCDQGAVARGHPYPGGMGLPNRGLMVTIQEEPSVTFACHAQGAAARNRDLHSQVAPANGTYAWALNPPGVVAFVGAVNQGNVRVATVAGGTTTITVTYQRAGMVEHASLEFTVVQVTIAEGQVVGAPLGQQVQLNANFAPAHGTLLWTAANGGVAVINGAANAALVTLNTVGAGTSLIHVDCTAGQTHRATLTLVVASVVIVEGASKNVKNKTQATFNVQVSPPGGAIKWSAGDDRARATIHSGHNRNQVTINAKAIGTTPVAVTYTVNGMTFEASINMIVE